MIGKGTGVVKRDLVLRKGRSKSMFSQIILPLATHLYGSTFSLAFTVFLCLTKVTAPAI